MLQIYVYDSTGAKFELDLYEEQPLKLTLSIEDIKDIPTVNSAFSKEFRIPATQNNSRVFKWWYEVNTVDFDITQRVVAELYVDGEFYKSGHIRINAAFVNEQTSNIDLGVIFFGETRDFASRIAEITIDQLELTRLNHELTIQNVQDSWAGTLKNGDIRYALAVRGYDYDDVGDVIQNSEIAEKNEHPQNRSFQKSNYPLNIDQLTPTIRVKAIIDAIFEQTGYTYSSDSIFNDAYFADLYTDGITKAEAQINKTSGLFEARTVGGQYFQFSQGGDYVDFTNEINDPSNSYFPGNSRYSVPADGNYTINATFNFEMGRGLFNQKPKYRAIMVQGGSTILADTGLVQVPQGLGSITIPINLTYTGPLTQTTGSSSQVNVQLLVQDSNGNNEVLEDGVFECTSAANPTVNVTTLLRYDVKCVDFLKSILTKFKLIMAPSPTNDFEFVIKPWQDYMGSGQNFDWTEKLDVNKDVVLKPIFFEQSQLIDFKDQPDEDMKNKPFQELNSRGYGELQFDSQNDLLRDTRTIDTLFAPTPVDVVPGFPDTSDFVVPFFCKEDATNLTIHDAPEKIPLRIKPRLLWWNGLAAQGVDEDWWYTDGVTDIHNLTDYPRFTQYSVFPSTAATINLNWFRDTPYFTDPNLGEGMYEKYWNVYIQELYSPLARIFTGYFNIDSQDLYNLSFDDVIFIKNAFYRVLKVYDAPLTETATVKVDLVKLLDYKIASNPGNPTGNGGGIDYVDVTGGGGANNNPPVFKYQVEDCDVPGAYLIVESSVALSIGQAIKVVGGIYNPDACFEVIAVSLEPKQADVNSIYIDCADCTGPLDGTWGDTDTEYGDTDVPWGGTGTDTYYIVEDCDTGTNVKYVTSQTVLQLGDAVKISGNPNLDICFTVIDYSATGQDATVLEIFPDCFSCEQ